MSEATASKTMAQREERDGETSAREAFARMLEDAEDWEADVVAALRVRAGLLWICAEHECGMYCTEDEAACWSCGTPRRTCSCGMAWADEDGHDDGNGHALAHKLTAEMNEPEPIPGIDY